MSADIVITELMDEAAVADLAAEFAVIYDPHLHSSPRLIDAAAAARALIVRHETQVGRALLDACTRLEVVGRLGAALDNIDLAACARRNIAVLPATGANAIAVAEYVICTLLMLLRGSFLSTEAVARGEWPRPALIGREACSKTLGLIGFGAVARTLAARASAMGMRVLAHDPLIPLDSVVWREYPAVSASLEELLEDYRDFLKLNTCSDSL